MSFQDPGEKFWAKFHEHGTGQSFHDTMQDVLRTVMLDKRLADILRMRAERPMAKGMCRILHIPLSLA